MSEPNSFFKRSLKSAFSIFIKQTKILNIKHLSKDFVLIEMMGTKLKEARWIPGSKVQIDVGNLTYRTYTPIHLDSTEGKLSVICYERKEGPASKWINTIKVGDSCDVFGPRESLDFSSLEGDTILFGDETSFGISTVLQNIVKKKSHLFLELNSKEAVKETLKKLDITESKMYERTTDGSHLQKLSEDMIDLISKIPDAKIFLTGRASSIQKVRAQLKNFGIPTNKLKVRVYWADGKIGLD